MYDSTDLKYTIGILLPLSPFFPLPKGTFEDTIDDPYRGIGGILIAIKIKKESTLFMVNLNHHIFKINEKGEQNG